MKFGFERKGNVNKKIILYYCKSNGRNNKNNSEKKLIFYWSNLLHNSKKLYSFNKEYNLIELCSLISIKNENVEALEEVFLFFKNYFLMQLIFYHKKNCSSFTWDKKWL